MLPPDDHETAQIAGLFDPDWYRSRYPGIVPSGDNPLQHFLRYGFVEKHDPNRFFDSEWYLETNPDVASSGLHPLIHYLRAGAKELRNPNARFDAAYYVEQHPDAKTNPLQFHVRVGQRFGYLTEKPIDIRDYLPSRDTPLALNSRAFADVVIPVHRGLDLVRRCILSVLANRDFPLARIIVIDDHTPEPKLAAWLKNLAVEGQIHLIRNRRHLGFEASAGLGILAAETHDVVLLGSDTRVPAGWLRRLAAHAYAQANIATVSPFCNDAAHCGYPDDAGGPIVFRATPERMDEVCQTVNAGRSVEVSVTAAHCMYIRRAAEQAVGWGADFCSRAASAGWVHRLACDVFVYRDGSGATPPPPEAAFDALTPSRFAVTAALFRDANLPVILMISHHYGGGVKRHIDSLVERYRGSALVLLLAGTNRGTTLSVASLPNHPVLVLPPDRLDDMVTVLRSMQVSRVHIHHLLQMGMNVRSLIHRLDVPFDVTVHDYFAICPQVNLLRWPEALYCGEPGPESCNACIAEQGSHGARDIVSWRRDRAWQFLNADRVICPSADTKARLDRYGLGERAIVVPHELQIEITRASRPPNVAGQPLRIALLGVLANHKGARVVAELAEAAAPGTIDIHLIGHVESSFPKAALGLIKTTGKYRDEQLPELLRQIDPHVLWFPAVWPETYSYTLSAAIATGLPIVATDLGSFPERLAGYPHAWLVDYRASSEDWLTTFANVRDALKNRSVKPPVPGARQIPDFYADRYLTPGPRKSLLRAPGKLRIAIVPERFGSGGLTPSAYIRLLQPLDHPGSGATDVIIADAETIFDCEADIVMTQGHAIPNLETANRLVEHARRTGAKLVYDLDDDLLDVPAGHPDTERLRPLTKVVRRMLSVADAVWVSTAGLAERLMTIRPDAVVVENRLDERIWAKAPMATIVWDHPVRILCMGSRKHDLDFALIEPALLRLKDAYGHLIAIDIIGMTSGRKLPDGLNRIHPATHASRSYPGFVNWLTSVQPRWHIGLAPLLDTTGNRAASPIKAMDYAALGLAVLASDTPAYRGSIADGPGGQLVANDPGAWYSAMDWLIRNQELRQSMATRAYRAFLDRGTVASQADMRRAALTAVMSDQALPVDQALATHGLATDALATDQAPGLRRAAGALTIPYDPSDPVTRKRRPGSRGR